MNEDWTNPKPFFYNIKKVKAMPEGFTLSCLQSRIWNLNFLMGDFLHFKNTSHGTSDIKFFGECEAVILSGKVMTGRKIFSREAMTKNSTLSGVGVCAGSILPCVALTVIQIQALRAWRKKLP